MKNDKLNDKSLKLNNRRMFGFKFLLNFYYPSLLCRIFPCHSQRNFYMHKIIVSKSQKPEAASGGVL